MLADAFRPKWRHSDPAVRRRAVVGISDRETLETIVESDAPTDVRQIAADRLFGDDHVRTHARRSVREAAVRVLGDLGILRAIAESDSDPNVKAIALARLGDDGAVQTCGICGNLTLASIGVCKCGYDLAGGDLASAKTVCVEGRRRGTKELIGGALVTLIGLAGGVSFLPIHLDFFFVWGNYKADLIYVIPGCITMMGGWLRRSQPWRALAK
jgi:hypothetical protein